MVPQSRAGRHLQHHATEPGDIADREGDWFGEDLDAHYVALNGHGWGWCIYELYGRCNWISFR